MVKIGSLTLQAPSATSNAGQALWVRTSTGYIFLDRSDLEAMVAFLDAQAAGVPEDDIDLYVKGDGSYGWTRHSEHDAVWALQHPEASH